MGHNSNDLYGRWRNTGKYPIAVKLGCDRGDHTDLLADPSDSRSALEITGSPAAGSVFTNGALETVGTITHWNNAISSAFSILETGVLSFSVVLNAIDPLGGTCADNTEFFVQLRGNKQL